MDDLEVTPPAGAKATYGEIKAYVKEHTGLAFSSLYIAQEKQEYEVSSQPQCPPKKEAEIRETLEHFKMV